MLELQVPSIHLDIITLVISVYEESISFKHNSNSLNFSYQKMCQHVEAFYEHVSKAIKAGVKLALGTDAGTFMNPLEGTAKELTRAGASNYQALRAAGLGSAELLKIDRNYGSLEVGKYADFLVLKNNPLTDVTVVEQVDKQVYQHGKRKY